MLNIILFGPPGSGKGTQSAKLIDKYNLIHLSTGDVLRYEIKNQTQMGIDAKRIIDKGNLVPDSIMIGMVRHFIDSNKNVNGIIFDGFPRTNPQAVALDDLLKDEGTIISCMLALDVDEQELKKRLYNRAKEQNRPDDQDEKIIANRIKVYKNDTEPVKEHYVAQNKYYGIDGMGEIDDIFERLCDTINKL